VKAVELTLNHKCYHVTVDEIREAEIDGLVRSLTHDKKMVVAFKDDNKKYVIPFGAQSIFQLYFFSFDEAVERQKKLRMNAFKANAIKKALKEGDYSLVMELKGKA
jgi:predicted methyltransferase MtxX (methanogen marker protein 4)